jgi:hypothetical protein
MTLAIRDLVREPYGAKMTAWVGDIIDQVQINYRVKSSQINSISI